MPQPGGPPPCSAAQRAKGRDRSPLHAAGLAPARRRAWARQVASARHEPRGGTGAQEDGCTGSCRHGTNRGRHGRAGGRGILGGMAEKRTRMSGVARREQLVAVGRSLFAEKGFDATSVEEIAARAKVSKPVVYEHFGGKEGLYAVVVDREVQSLIASLHSSLESSDRPGSSWRTRRSRCSTTSSRTLTASGSWCATPRRTGRPGRSPPSWAMSPHVWST